MKKILLVMELPPPIHGQSTMNKQVADILKDSGFPCIIINSGLSKTMGVKGKVTLEKFVLLFKLFYEVLNVSIFRKCKISYISIYPFGVPFTIYLIVVVILRYIGRNKIIIHLHVKGIKNKIRKSPILKKCYLFFFKNSDLVVHLSQTLVEDITDVVDAKKIIIIPNAIKLLGEIPKSLRPHSPLRVLFLSNMDIAKGCLIVLRAAKKLILSGKLFEFWFVGNWVQESVKKEFELVLNNNQLKQSIKYLGPKYGEEKNIIYSESDIFIFPAFEDAWGLVVNEAMACGMPTLCSKYAGCCAYLIKEGENGYSFDPFEEDESPNSLVNLLLKFSDDPNLVKRMGDNSKLIYETTYNYDLFRKNILGLFRDLHLT